MKAKTKFQRRVVELAKKLKPITDKQEQWMLKQVDPIKTDSWNENFFSIMQVIEDCQVFRVFQIYCSAPENRNGYASERSAHKCISNIGECYQVWIDSKGQRTIYGYNRGGSFCGWQRACYSFRRKTCVYEMVNGGYTWHYEPAEMTFKQVGAPTSYSQYYYGVFSYPTTYKGMLCPIGREYLPEFVRNNGYSYDLPKDCEGDDWVRWMLDSKTERVYKMNKDLLSFYVTQVPYKWRNKFFTAIRTAHKHKYFGLEKNNLPIWKDHIECCIKNGLPMNHPHVVCPPDLIEAHNRMIAERQRREEQERIRRDRERAQAQRIADLKKVEEMKDAARKYAKRMEKYDGIIVSDDKYMVMPCMTMQSMAIEGAEMHHCVFSMKYYEKKDSLILLCRDHDGNRATTIELSLKSGEILQCYAKHDHKHDDDKRIKELVKDNVQTFLLAGKKQNIKKLNNNNTAERPTQVALAA